jgi:hypothetical protein
MVVCAAVIALAAGGAGVFGGLGSIFGSSGPSLQVAKAGPPAADIVAAPTAATRLASRPSELGSTPRNRRNPGGRRPSASPRTPTQAPPAAGVPPTTGPVNPAPGIPSPPAPPAPAPAPAPVVTTVGGAIKQLTGNAPPEAKPLTKPIDDAVDVLVQTCTALPVCP